MAFLTRKLSHRDAALGSVAYLYLYHKKRLVDNFLAGFPFSFGVLNDYYTNHMPFSADPGGISAVGTTCSVSLSQSWYPPWSC
jgi:hypothetical protein